MRLISSTRIETAVVPLDISYRCSRCGKITHCVSALQITKYDKYGALSQSDFHCEQLPLSQIAYNALDDRLRVILDEQNADRYEVAQFRCACSFCGHIEPWSRLRYSRVDYLFRLISCIGLRSSILLLIGSLLFRSSLLFLVTVATLGVIWFLRFLRKAYKKWHRGKTQRAIAKLPPESLPKVSFDPSKKHLQPWPKSILTSSIPIHDPESYLKL